MRWSLFISVVVPLVLSGCGADTIGSMQSAEEFTLYSIDGRYMKPGTELQTPEKFKGFPVLGKIEIKDAEMRRKLIAAFREGYASRPSSGAKCFWPRHGIRAEVKGKIIEYVICFECFQFAEYLDGELIRHVLVNGNIKPSFDKPLIDAGIAIAPK